MSSEYIPELNGKPLVDMTFSELTTWAAQYAHLGLLEGGSHGLKGALHNIMSTAIEWRQEKDKQQPHSDR